MAIQLINSEFNFSYYNNLLSAKAPDNEFDINQLIEVIRYGYLKKEIITLRSLSDKKKRNKLKQYKLPCVTLSGTFKQRNKNNLNEHSGLIQIDIDDIKDCDYDSVFTTLISDEHTFVAFKSPSGNGIKLVVKINPSIETHLEQFLALQQYYKEEYGIEIDSACKDIARCMLLSYDPNIYCNPFSDVFPVLFMDDVKTPILKKNKVKYAVSVNSDNVRGIIESLTLEIERHGTDITDGYENWVRVGFSLAKELGESGRDYFHRLSRYHAEYNQMDCDRKYNQLFNTNKGSISLGTLIYIARLHGIEVKYPSRHNTDCKTLTPDISNIDKAALYETLKDKRLEIANKVGNPAYTIFTNKTLDELVEKMPKTEVEFLDIYGISQKRCDAYAKDFLPLILNFKRSDSPVQKPSVQKYIIPKLKNQDEKLFQELRAFRLQHALEKGLKAFHVFGNTTLNEIVDVKPKTKAELLDVKGIGQLKLEQIGDPILEIITKYAS